MWMLTSGGYTVKVSEDIPKELFTRIGRLIKPRLKDEPPMAWTSVTTIPPRWLKLSKKIKTYIGQKKYIKVDSQTRTLYLC